MTEPSAGARPTILPVERRVDPYRDYARHGSVLVLNAGSSSLKYQLVNPGRGEVAGGIVERIGEATAIVKHEYGDAAVKREEVVADHGQALRIALGLFDEVGPALAEAGIYAVGHRVVHGGSIFAEPTVIDDGVVAKIAELSPLAPLHNPPNLKGIEVGRELLAEVPHVAVFDTAFFAGLPPAAATYAIDREVAREHGVRRYGFHGTSHYFVSREVARLLGRPLGELNTVVLHLGNGASASAVRGGVPIDTSMGLTPLEGLVMGTRSGDLDPAVVFHLARNAGMSIDEIDTLLNKKSGLKGLTGENDWRVIHDLIAAGDADAKVALDVYTHRLKKYIGAYHAVLGRLDVVAFTAGVGENDDVVRAGALRGLEPLGIELDEEANEGRIKEPRIVSAPGSRVVVIVVPTMEELTIARMCVEAVEGVPAPE